VTISPEMLFNQDALDAFVSAHGYTHITPLGKDSSIRRYYRAQKNEKSAIVMESVPDNSPHMTRGHKLSDYLRLSAWLNDNGLKAPEIYAADEKAGYLILEDFGDLSFKKALEQGANAHELYKLAAEVLKKLRAIDPPANLPEYYDSHVHANHRFILDYYAQKPEYVEEYLQVWKDIRRDVPCPEKCFQHIDFHVENLMFLPDEKGLKQCGILDFQGAMLGPVPYDLANLLEDARYTIEKDIRADILAPYDEQFKAQYRILATQFHCRCIGQFIKIANETGNKTYLAHIPRLEGYILEALEEPILEPLKAFFARIGVDFSSAKAF